MNLNEIALQLPELGAEGTDALPVAAARDLERRAVRFRLRLDAEHGPDPRERRGGADVQADDQGRDRPLARCLHRRRADDVRLLRRAVQPGRRHDGRALQPDPVPHLPRPSRLPRRGPAALRRAGRRAARLAAEPISRLPARRVPTGSTSPGCSHEPTRSSADLPPNTMTLDARQGRSVARIRDADRPFSSRFPGGNWMKSE